MNNKRKLFHLTRTSSFLWKTSLGLLLLFVVIGTLLWKVAPRTEEVSYEEMYLLSTDENFEIAINTSSYAQILELELQQDAPFEQKLQAIKYLVAVNPDPTRDPLPPAEQLPGLSKSQYKILSAFSQALRGINRATESIAARSLIELANQTPPLPHANFALSLYHSTTGKATPSIEAIKAEINQHPSDASRQHLVDLYSRYSQWDDLRELQTDPLYAPYFDNLLKRDLALQTMDWAVLISTLLPLAYEGMSLEMVLLALVTGLAWGSLVMRFNDSLSLSSDTVKLAIPALLLGALSAHITILAIYLQEDQFGLKQGGDLISQIIFCVAGIGLREEFLKLLCFVPLLPILLKRKDELEILLVASLVGLGFAVEENISYLEYSQGTAAIGRFITANFFHLALTGLCGHALAQAFIYGGSSINNAVSTLGIAILVHGAYDAFLIVPELADYSFAAIIILIIVAYQYFHTLRNLRSVWNAPFSVSAHFTYGLIFVFGASFLLLSWEIGPGQALMTLGADTLSLGLLIVMFYREIPEELE